MIPDFFQAHVGESVITDFEQEIMEDMIFPNNPALYLFSSSDVLMLVFTQSWARLYVISCFFHNF